MLPHQMHQCDVRVIVCRPALQCQCHALARTFSCLRLCASEISACALHGFKNHNGTPQVDVYARCRSAEIGGAVAQQCTKTELLYGICLP